MGTTARKWSRVLWSLLTRSLLDNLLAFVRVVYVSIEASGVYIVYGVRYSTRVTIKSAQRIPPEGEGWVSPEYLAQAVSTFVEDQKIVSAEFVLCIPSQWAIIQSAQFPPTVKGHLNSVVYNELDRITPLNPGNAFYDYSTMADDPDKLTILLAAVKRETMERYLEALRNKNIKIEKLSVSTFAIGSLIRNVYKNQNYIYVAGDENAYECGVVINGFPVRSVSGVVPSWENLHINPLIDDIRMLKDLLVQKGCLPRIVIWAQGDLYAKLKEGLKDIPAFHANKELKVVRLQKGKSISAAALGGFLESVRTNRNEFNLLLARTDKMNRKPFLLTGLLVAAITAIYAFYYFAPIVIEQKKVELIELRIIALKPEIKKIEVLKKEAESISSDIQVINNFKKHSVLSIDVLKEMTAIVPDKTWLTRIRMTESTAEIEGYATKATEIIPLLESSRLFQRAEFASPTFRDLRLNNERFVIKMDLKNMNVAKKKDDTGKKNETKK